VVNHVGHVATGHLSADIGLLDGVELEVVKVILGLADQVDGAELGSRSGDLGSDGTVDSSHCSWSVCVGVWEGFLLGCWRCCGWG
jgi:hypothetical protein